MSATTVSRDALRAGKGWRVFRPDGAQRMVLPRQEHDPDRYAVFAAGSTDALRDPPLGYPGSWGDLEHAIVWARDAT